MKLLLAGIILLGLIGSARAQSAQPVAGFPLVEWRLFDDPTEHAFTMAVPSGWQVRGGVARRNALQFWPWLSAIAPDGMTIIAFGDPASQSYVLPSQRLAMAGLYEGKIYDSGAGVYYVINRYVSGPQYAVAYAQRHLPQFCSGGQFVSGRERPDLAARIGTLVIPLTRITAGEARFTCQRNGMAMDAYVFAATSLSMTPMFGPDAGAWAPAYLIAYLAPKPIAAVAEQMVAHMLASIIVNPAWIGQNSELAVTVSHIATATGHAMSDTIMQSWQAKNATLDRIMEAGSRARLGIDIYRDPQTGTSYTVGNTHSYYWINPQGRIIGTDTDTAPNGFSRMQRVPPGAS